MKNYLLCSIVIALAACAGDTQRELKSFDLTARYDGLNEESVYHQEPYNHIDENTAYYYFVHRDEEMSMVEVIAVAKENFSGPELAIGNHVALRGKGAKVGAATGTSLILLEKGVECRKVD